MKTHSHRHNSDSDTRTAQGPRSSPTIGSPADSIPEDLTREVPSIALAKKPGVQMFHSATIILSLGLHLRGFKLITFPGGV